MELSTLYTKIQPGEAYVNMRGSEYLPMDPDDGSDSSPVAKADPLSGKVHYLNEKALRRNPEEESSGQDALRSKNKIDVINECEDTKQNKMQHGSSNTSGTKSPKSNGLDKHKNSLQRKPNKDGSGDVSIKSAASSGFHSDYAQDDVAAPPHYSMVVNENETSRL